MKILSNYDELGNVYNYKLRVKKILNRYKTCQNAPNPENKEVRGVYMSVWPREDQLQTGGRPKKRGGKKAR